MKNRVSMRSAVLAGSSAGALALALAAATPTPALAQDAGADEDRVVVTGSRIQRRDFEANSPIVTVEQEAFENRSSVNVESTLNELPQFVPSGTTDNTQNAAASPFPNATASPGAATLNLRGLGSNRSLVLINGRRPQPVNSALLVDVNSIPPAAIENVEVITGGAAAVYGADAIAGVVNFILRDDFEGFELDAQFGISERGDNEITQISALVGGNFASGRGNAMAGLMWSERGRALQKDREFFTRGWTDPDTNATGLGGTDLIRARFPTGPGAEAYYGINADGTLFDPMNADDPAMPFKGAYNALDGGAGFKLNDSGELGYITPGNEVTIPQTRYSIFTNAHYDLNDSISFFVDGMYTHTFVETLSNVPEAFDTWQLTIPYDSANDDPDSPTFGADPADWYPVSAPLADALNSAGVDQWTLNQGLPYISDRMRTNTSSDIFQITAGLRGDLAIKDWTWELYGSHGESSILSQMPPGHAAVSQANIQQIIDGVSATGAPTNTGAWGAGWDSGDILGVLRECQSGIPLFDTNGNPNYPITVTDGCVDYAGLEFNSVTKLERNIVEGTMQGGLFDIWAGEVRFAAGATYREEYFEFRPDTGYSGQQSRANAIGLILLPQSTSGSFDVSELYGELLVPVLSGLPMIQQLDLELGYRFSDYSTAGGVDTYKILGDWRMTDWLRIRGGYQRANRAPNVYELFAPVGSGFSMNYDPCVNIEDYTPDFGNVEGNPNRVNLQEACNQLIVRDGGFDYTTLADDPTNTGEPASQYPGGLDQTHMSNYRFLLFGYNFEFPWTISKESGNPNLESEVADTFTAGVVVNSPFTNPWVQGLRLSVDWYQIDLEGTIGTPDASVVYEQCLSAEFNDRMSSSPGTYSPTELLAGNPYCDLIERENINQAGVLAGVGSGRDRTYKARYVNQGGTNTSGVDVQINWGAQFDDLGIDAPGGLSASLVANYLLEFEESPFPGAAFTDYAGTLGAGGHYDYTLLGTTTYNVGPASIGFRVRHLPSIDPSPTSTNGLGTDSHTEVALFGRYQLNDTIELRGGVDNLFDVQPEVVGASTTNAALNSTNGYYDQIGRRFYIGATSRF